MQANSVPLAGTPSVSGNKTATLATDVNGNGLVNPGDTLMYSVVVSNGGTDAMNVVFTDQLNPNLTLIGTANASPIGVNDTYASIGNVGINVPDGVSDLLANDVDPNGNAMTISGIVGCADVTAPFVCTTANGGNITVQANGAFTYNSTPGFEGGDFFAYTVSDGQSPPKTDTANVTINVNEVIWFIDNNSANGWAMSVVTDLRSCKISLMVRRDTPSSFASLSCVNLAAGKTSSRKISPGCVGRRFLLFSQLFVIVSKSSAIVFKLNVESVLAFEGERDAPVAADRDAQRAGPIAFQSVQTITGQVQVCCGTSTVKHVKLPKQTSGKFGGHTTPLARFKEPLQSFMPKALYHAF